jgi:cell fate regulator YaaT (PSP1 superfamily)
MTDTCASSSALSEHLPELREYILSYGVAGEFGRFRPVRPIDARRGDRAVVRTCRGLEVAEVLCVARPSHATFLPNTTVGRLLRLVSPEDEAIADRAKARAAELFDAARQVAGELGLPLEVLDAEVLLDGEQAVLHHLSWDSFDERELVGRLGGRFDLRVMLHSLKTAAEEAEDGCGKENCGGGNCSSCGSGGCGTCTSHELSDLRDHFAGLREQMEARNASRTPLV